MESTKGKQIVKGAFIISLFTLIGRSMGYVQKLAMAHFFGTGMAADAYTLASGSIVVPIALFPKQLLDPFLPLFSERRKKEGDAAAWRLAGSVATILALALVVVAAIGMILAPRLAAWVSSFDSEETTVLSGRLVRIMMPSLAFTGLFALTALLLNAYKRFTLPAVGDTINKIMLILCLAITYRFLGVRGLAAGVVVGAMTGVALLVFGLRGRVQGFRWGVDWRDPALRQLGGLMLPILFSSLIGWSRTVMDSYFASGMREGSVAGINYARGLVDTIVQLIPAAVGVAIYPFFSDESAARDREAMTNMLIRALRMMVFLFVPITLILIALRMPVIQLAFQYGKFTRESAALTAAPFGFYALGLTVVAMEGLLMRFYFASKNTLTPAVVGALCVLVHLAVILVFKESLQNASMALASTVSKGVKVGILFLLLKRILPNLQWRKNGLFALRMIAAGALMAAVLLVARQALNGLLPSLESVGKPMRLAWLAVKIGTTGATGAFTFIAAAFLLRLEEATAIGTWIGRRLWKKRYA